MHKTKDYTALIGTLEGLNADLIEDHLKLYAGYVKKYNEINETLTDTERVGNYSYAAHSELIRRRSVAWNGARLHELYFEGLTPGGSDLGGDLKTALERDFGSVDAWRKDLKACVSATPGWVLLVRNRVSNTLQHYVVFEHMNNVPVDVDILLALDCWEHAFAKQYGTDKGGYLGAFLENLHGEEIGRRLNKEHVS